MTDKIFRAGLHFTSRAAPKQVDLNSVLVSASGQIQNHEMWPPSVPALWMCHLHNGVGYLHLYLLLWELHLFKFFSQRLDLIMQMKWVWLVNKLTRPNPSTGCSMDFIFYLFRGELESLSFTNLLSDSECQVYFSYFQSILLSLYLILHNFSTSMQHKILTRNKCVWRAESNINTFWTKHNKNKLHQNTEQVNVSQHHSMHNYKMQHK